MRYALLSDIHGNLEACQAVIKALEDEKVDSYVCLGDIVGYGANPCECIDIIKDLKATTVAGNHDYAVVNLTDIKNFSDDAQAALIWTQTQLRAKDKRFLSRLKLITRLSVLRPVLRSSTAAKYESATKDETGFTVVHATLQSPEKWGYVLSTYEATQNFRLMEGSFLFIGHSHAPLVFEENEVGECRYRPSEETLELKEKHRYILNIGSVGQPRGGDPRAVFAIYDSQTCTVQIKRVEYNLNGAMKKIVDAGLPKKLAWRLSVGE